MRRKIKIKSETITRDPITPILDPTKTIVPGDVNSDSPGLLDSIDDGSIDIAIYAKTVGCITLDTVSLGEQSIQGESEPVYDGKYERNLIKLVPAKEAAELNIPAFRNENELTWYSSIDWQGPFVALVAYDDDGKKIARCNTGREDIIQAGMAITVKPGGATFTPIIKDSS